MVRAKINNCKHKKERRKQMVKNKAKKWVPLKNLTQFRKRREESSFQHTENETSRIESSTLV